MFARPTLTCIAIYITTLILRLLQIHTIYIENKVGETSILIKENAKLCEFETNIYRISVASCHTLALGKRVSLTVTSPSTQYGDNADKSIAISSHAAISDKKKIFKKSLIATDATPYQYKLSSPKDWFWYLEEKLYNSVLSIRSKIYQNIPSNSAWLVINSVLGYLAPIPRSYDTALAVLGLQHVIAVSGSHISFLLILLSRSSTFFLTRKARLVWIGWCTCCYWFAIGTQPSVNRAVVMGLLCLVMKEYLFIQVRYLRLLAVVARFWILYEPAVIFSVSFQLSYLATLGILLFTEDNNFISALETNRVPQGRRAKLYTLFIDSFKVSMIAQVYTTGVIWYHFQQYAMLSLVANTCIFWLPPLLMILGFVAVAWGATSFLPIQGVQLASSFIINTVLTLPAALCAGIFAVGQYFPETILELPTINDKHFVLILGLLGCISLLQVLKIRRQPVRHIKLREITACV